MSGSWPPMTRPILSRSYRIQTEVFTASLFNESFMRDEFGVASPRGSRAGLQVGSVQRIFRVFA